MNKITKTLLSVLTIALILGLAFYPKIKKTFFAEETKEKGKEKSGPGGKGGKTSVIVTVVKSTRLDDMISSTGGAAQHVQQLFLHSHQNRPKPMQRSGGELCD